MKHKNEDISQTNLPSTTLHLSCHGCWLNISAEYASKAFFLPSSLQIFRIFETIKQKSSVRWRVRFFGYRLLDVTTLKSWVSQFCREVKISNNLKSSMAYVMTLFWRSTKFIFCRGKSFFFNSPMLGIVLEKEDDFHLKQLNEKVFKMIKKMIETKATHLHTGQLFLKAPGTLLSQPFEEVFV